MLNFDKEEERRTDSSFVKLGIAQFEDVVDISAVLAVHGFDIQTEFLDKGTSVASPGVGVGIPSLLLHDEGRFGQKSLEPTCVQITEKL